MPTVSARTILGITPADGQMGRHQYGEVVFPTTHMAGVHASRDYPQKAGSNRMTLSLIQKPLAHPHRGLIPVNVKEVRCAKEKNVLTMRAHQSPKAQD